MDLELEHLIAECRTAVIDATQKGRILAAALRERDEHDLARQVARHVITPISNVHLIEKKIRKALS